MMSAAMSMTAVATRMPHASALRAEKIAARPNALTSIIIASLAMKPQPSPDHCCASGVFDGLDAGASTVVDGIFALLLVPSSLCRASGGSVGRGGYRPAPHRGYLAGDCRVKVVNHLVPGGDGVRTGDDLDLSCVPEVPHGA